MALSVSTAQFFASFRDSSRSLQLGQSHASLVRHYASKSSSGKFAQLGVDSDRLYLPGEEIKAVVNISPATVADLESIEVDFKCEIHTFGWVQGGPGRGGVGGARQRKLRKEKQVLFQSSSIIQVPSMAAQQKVGIMTVQQRSADNPLLFDAVSRIPASLAPKRNSNIRMPLPPVYHDGSDEPCAFITYHWKLTAHRKSSMKTDERLWKPIMVMSLAQEPNDNPLLAQSVLYPPSNLFAVRGMYREVKKYMVKTAALMEIELAVPSLTNHPIFRPVPVIIRLSVRAKAPSDLLETGVLTLPTLPGGAITNGSGPGSKDKATPSGPQFVLRRIRRSEVSGSPIEESREKSVCNTQWDTGHVDNGFTQQADGKGYEGGREGSTPVADQRAHAGLSHGWTWPARSDPGQDAAFFSTPTVPFGKGPLSKNQLTGSSGTPTMDMLKSFHYVTTSTLFAKVYLGAHPSVNVPNLLVFNDLSLNWQMEGARNDVDARICGVEVNLGLDASQAMVIDQEELKNAVLQPENLGDESLLLQGYAYDPPAPPPFSRDDQLPSYPGPSTSASSSQPNPSSDLPPSSPPPPP
ncbi:hypothetical protein CBS101457_005760 [Exobasidium rhododendri]|nr:hypothetical protein CBS101457_005760 [Exobasidium rhododendri]